jgi:hypothetical protein
LHEAILGWSRLRSVDEEDAFTWLSRPVAGTSKQPLRPEAGIDVGTRPGEWWWHGATLVADPVTGDGGGSWLCKEGDVVVDGDGAEGGRWEFSSPFVAGCGCGCCCCSYCVGAVVAGGLTTRGSWCCSGSHHVVSQHHTSHLVLRCVFKRGEREQEGKRPFMPHRDSLTIPWGIIGVRQ